MWADRYKPETVAEMCYPSTALHVKDWLVKFVPYSPTAGGKANAGPPRAALLSGPPGVGKTTSAHLVAKELGYTVVEYNTSDFRSRKSLRENVSSMINNKNFALSGQHYTAVLLLMDEVDGCDMGGVGEIIQMIKTTKIPIICTCNDRFAPKLKSLVNYCEDIKFSRPPCNIVANYLYDRVLLNEGVTLNKSLLKDIVKRGGSDIRSMLNNLQMWCKNNNSNDKDNNNNNKESNGKSAPIVISERELATRALASEKDPGYGLFDSAEFFLLQGSSTYQNNKNGGGGRNDKNNNSNSQNIKFPTMDEYYTVYFNSDMIDLFVQENYLRFNPAKLLGLTGEEEKNLYLERTAQSAASISQADAAQRIMFMEQNWSVSKYYILASSIAPVVYNRGKYESFVTNTNQTFFDRQRPVKFPSYFGNLSTGNKNKRLAKLMLVQGSSSTNHNLNKNNAEKEDRQTERSDGHTASIRRGLGFTGGVEDLVQDYIPLAIKEKLTRPFYNFDAARNDSEEKEKCIREVIDFMDVYHLQRDDWDFVQEMTEYKHFTNNHNTTTSSSSSAKGAVIPTALKSAFTREYNKTHKADSWKVALKNLTAPEVDPKAAGGAGGEEDDEEEEDEVEAERKKLLLAQQSQLKKGKPKSSPGKRSTPKSKTASPKTPAAANKRKRVSSPASSASPSASASKNKNTNKKKKKEEEEEISISDDSDDDYL